MPKENPEKYNVKSKKDVSIVITKRNGDNSILLDKNSNNPLKK
jgi:hypothetical protein